MLDGPLMRTLMAVMVLLPTLALAQPAVADVTAPPEAVAAPPESQPAGEVVASPYWSTCRQIWARAPYAVGVHHGYFLPPNATLPTGSTGSTGSGGSGGSSAGRGAPSTGGGSGFSGGGGAGAGYAILALAVVVIAALPIVIYAVDSDADALTLERFYCPEFSFTAHGGVQLPSNGQQVMGLGIAKVRADIGYVGAMADLGIMPSGNNIGATFSAHFLVRPPPKAHIEGALALGGRRAIGPGGSLDGLEVALPHTYVFSRDGYRKMGLELMPRVFINRAAVDFGADLAFVAPIADVLMVRAGIGAFSHARQVQLTASAGLVAHF